jgi:hypothetical protein
MIAQKVVQAQPEATEYYELFELAEMEDKDGATVEVKKSIGKVNTTQLEEEKARYQEQIAKVDEKLAVIALINK